MRVVATCSVKGGAGKSLVSANLAYELKDLGLRVGLLDADLDSPYLVELAGVQGKIGLDAERRMIPVVHDSLLVMSFALWGPDAFDGATMHGSMHERWIEDALRYTAWGDLDILVVDLPAGAGDPYLTLKRVCGSDLLGFIAVAQPHVLSGLRRVYNAAAYHRMRILGVIENMSGPAFGTGQIEEFCKGKVPFLGSIPLDPRIRAANEKGEPRLPPDLRGPVQRAAEQVQAALSVAKEVVA